MANGFPLTSRLAPAAPGGGPGSVLVDLSHEITAGATAYPGLPQPELTDHVTREESRAAYAPGTEFHIGRLCLVGQTGTYLDVPFHRYADGFDLTRLDLAQVAGRSAVVIDTEERSITPAAFAGRPLRGRAVLIRTNWSRFWGMAEYGSGEHPHLSAEAARYLAAEAPAVVGIDSLNIDGTHTGERPAHSELLGAGIPVVEHLTNLSQLPSEGARFTAVPVKVAGLGTFPVRAYAAWNRWT
ncbi:cyclase family protein [Streptomyces sp. TRM 70351]|uniref:cyclase family protein n=1 Tax=Streptomyces sp. TRM 70351 TaxID=3116552 RepID=UPI002E7ADAC1|nr:cyclase family protein [Streptomyces sp. TRM 70351]MEE1930440.1 cyclase family protein [Streptomyces sp. TRM 70351]